MTEKEINEASERGTKMAQPRRAPSDGSATCHSLLQDAVPAIDALLIFAHQFTQRPLAREVGVLERLRRHLNSPPEPSYQSVTELAAMTPPESNPPPEMQPASFAAATGSAFDPLSRQGILNAKTSTDKVKAAWARVLALADRLESVSLAQRELLDAVKEATQIEKETGERW